MSDSALAQKKERNKAVPAVYLFLRKEKSVLLIRRQNSGYYDGWYSMPAGHVEANELPLAALVREVKEEIGISVQETDLRHVHTMYRAKMDVTGDRVDLFFEALDWKGEIENKEPLKCDCVDWFPLDDLPENIVHNVRNVIECIKKDVPFSELSYKDTEPNPSA